MNYQAPTERVRLAMITVIEVPTEGPPIVTRVHSYSVELPVGAVRYFVDGTRVTRWECTSDGPLFDIATGFQLIQLHDALNPSEKLYRFATRALALERLLEVLNARGTSVEERVGPPSGTAGDVQTSDGDQCPVARSRSSTDVPGNRALAFGAMKER